MLREPKESAPVDTEEPTPINPKQPPPRNPKEPPPIITTGFSEFLVIMLLLFLVLSLSSGPSHIPSNELPGEIPGNQLPSEIPSNQPDEKIPNVIYGAIGIIVLMLVLVIAYFYVRLLLRRLRQNMKSRKQKLPKEAIIEIMVQKKSKDIYYLVMLSFMFMILPIIVPQLFSSDINFAIIILCFANLLLLLGQSVLEFRVVQGRYGTNEREAREIIEFIINASSNVSFGDGGSPKKILRDDDLKELESTISQLSKSAKQLKG